MLQRELAVVTPHDSKLRREWAAQLTANVAFFPENITMVGTDDTTTCCSVIIRHTGSGVVALAHFDGSGLEEGVDTAMHRIQECSHHQLHGHLQLHLVGGFLDEQNYSQQLVMQLLGINLH